MTETTTASVRAAGTAAARHRGPALVGLVLLIIGVVLAVSVDVVRVGFGGPKADEATYVSMALSAAYDRDLTYERRDLERFWGLYRTGPEGLFLKRGKGLELGRARSFPYVRLAKRIDARADRLYFGKAIVYPLVAAPFVRLLDLNGLLLLNVLLLAAVCACGYVFLAARSSPTAAAIFTSAFIGAAAVPVYVVFLTPEIFNFAVVFFAYFVWLHKAGKEGPRGRLRDIAAAALLGLATYSKPTNGLLIAPLILVPWISRRPRYALLVAVAFVATTAICFGLTAAISGEFNFQGGDRKTFYGVFPFDAPDATWDRRGISKTTNGEELQTTALDLGELPARFGLNAKYFLVGRHFGFIPYFFPGAVAIVAWLFSSCRRDGWRILIFLTLVASTVGLLVLLPYTWSGGGGPPGNRYFLSLYPLLFFLVPPLDGSWLAVLAWMGGALFTAKMLANPFVAAKFPYQTTERGAARRLPVELTMANDLPVMLNISRAPIPYLNDPTMLLYFLDENAFLPEPLGMWVTGGGRADILVRTIDPIDHLSINAESPIHTVLTVSMGGPDVSMTLVPGRVATFDVPASGVRGSQHYAYLLSARSSDGFIPKLQNPSSTDFRNLGALLRFQAIPVRAPQ